MFFFLSTNCNLFFICTSYKIPIRYFRNKLALNCCSCSACKRLVYVILSTLMFIWARAENEIWQIGMRIRFWGFVLSPNSRWKTVRNEVASDFRTTKKQYNDNGPGCVAHRRRFGRGWNVIIRCVHDFIWIRYMCADRRFFAGYILTRTDNIGRFGKVSC